MQVSIKNVEKKKGMVRSKKFYGVELTVNFSQEELAIIKERNLAKTIIVERDRSVEQGERSTTEIGVVTGLAKAALKGTHTLTDHLTLAGLLKNPTDTHFFTKPSDAKEYVEDVKNGLTDLKGYIEGNAEVGGDESFEL